MVKFFKILCFYYGSYGIHLAQALTKTVIDRGYTPFVVIRPENDASRNLYKKLGFVKAFETCRVTLNPAKMRAFNGRAHAAANGNGNVDGDDAHAQTDEGIEDLRNDSVHNICDAQQNDDEKDEGIDEGERDD